MSDNMRIIKFKMMIRDIWEYLDKETLTKDINGLNGKYINDGWGTAWLAIIYDYDKLNDYGKAIMDQVCMLDEEEFGNRSDEVEKIIEFVNNCKDTEYKMKAAKALAVQLNNNIDDVGAFLGVALSKGNKPKLYFIFWALMILAVDDTNKEEDLSLICDFAKILRISDLEMMDIVQVIRVVFHKKTEKIIAPRVKACFERLLNKYGYQESLFHQ